MKNYEIHFDFTLVLFPYNIQGQTLIYRKKEDSLLY